MCTRWHTVNWCFLEAPQKEAEAEKLDETVDHDQTKDIVQDVPSHINVVSGKLLAEVQASITKNEAEDMSLTAHRRLVRVNRRPVQQISLDTTDVHQHAIKNGLCAEMKLALGSAPPVPAICSETTKLIFKTAKTSTLAVLDVFTDQLLEKTAEERQEARSIAEKQLEALKLEREILMMKDSSHSGSKQALLRKPVRPVGGALQVFSHSACGLPCLRGLSAPKRTLAVKKLWNELPEDRKAEAEKVFRDMLSKYHSDKAEYQQGGAVPETLLPGVPPKPKRPVGGWQKMCSSCLKDEPSLKGLPIIQRNARLKELCSQQPDHKKAEYETMFRERMAQYYLDKAAWEDAVKGLPAEEKTRLKRRTCSEKKSEPAKKVKSRRLKASRPTDEKTITIRTEGEAR